MVSLPYHTDAHSLPRGQLFAWEGVAAVTYAEHRWLHPKKYKPLSAEWNYFEERWLGDATGIIQTMINRTKESYGNPYDSPNHAALGGGYAPAVYNPTDPQGIYQEFYGLAFMAVELNVSVAQPYPNFSHQDLNDINGHDPKKFNGPGTTDTAAFGPLGPEKKYYVSIYPAIYK